VVAQTVVKVGMQRRVRAVAGALLAAAGLVVAVAPLSPASASEPEEHSIKVGTEPGVATYTWKGEIPPAPTGLAGNAGDSCLGDPDLEDVHTIKIDLGPRVYKSVIVEYLFQISWEDAGNDLAMTVFGPTGSLGSSDGGDPVETVPAVNVDEGEYTVAGCSFAAVGPTEYTGTLRVTSKARPKPKTAPTTTPPATPSAGSTGSGTSATTAVSSPLSASAAPAPRRASSSARSVATTTPTTAIADVAPVQAAPPAFISSGIDPIETATPPTIPVVAKETKKMPLGVAGAVCVAGLVGLVLALLVRRRRGLDATPGTAVVPVSG
jgi:hypothetical protein